MASIQYRKLFDMLAHRGYKKTDLREEVGLSTVTIAKLSKGESVTTDTSFASASDSTSSRATSWNTSPTRTSPRSSRRARRSTPLLER